MKNRGRVRPRRIGLRSKIDVGRLSAAVSRPGIDPRRWIEYARVTDIGVDLEQGVFVDLRWLSDGQKNTAFLGSPYAGADFGALYNPKVGDIVLACIPGGDENAGPVILSRIWNAANPPPPEFAAEGAEPNEFGTYDVTDNPTFVVEPTRTMRVVARDGATVRVEVSGSGALEVVATGAAQVRVTCESTVILDCPDVRLGDAPGSQVARIGDLVVGSTQPLGVGGNPAAPVVPILPLQPTVSGGCPVVGQIVSGARGVKA